MGQLEERMARIEGIVEQMNERLNHLETLLGQFRGEVESEIGSLRGEIGSLRVELSSQFRWTLGLLITMWITLILAIVLH
jgi:tetrahydromethanopterin S-methyltransferase subunit B